MLTVSYRKDYFKKLIDPFLPNLAVLSFSEIDSNIQIQAIGVVRPKDRQSNAEPNKRGVINEYG
jgi:Flagellar biosynthesis pathway, component FlhA